MTDGTGAELAQNWRRLAQAKADCASSASGDIYLRYIYPPSTGDWRKLNQPRTGATLARGAARTVLRCRYLLSPKSATQMTPEKALGQSLLT